MVASQEKITKDLENSSTPISGSGLRSSKIDRTAPAGSENSLGAQSVRDGRPATDDSTVEAMDEEGLGISSPPATDKQGN